MKRYIPVTLAVLVGLFFTFFLFKTPRESGTVSTYDNAVAIQIGVFTDFDSAEDMSKRLGGIVYEDEGVYRVYYSVLSNLDNINYMKNYLEHMGISYYLKSVTVPSEVLMEMSEYEALMSKTSEKAKNAINEKLLKMYEEVI